MYRKFLILLLAAALSACNVPTAPPATATPDAIATQVSLLLTQAPTQALPSAAATDAPAATETPAPTATAEAPTATLPPAQPTPTSSPTAAAEPPDWSDSLDGGKSFYKYENDNTLVKQEGGHLALTGKNADGWMGWSLTFSRKPADFRLEAVFTTQACTGTDLYGLVLRAPDANRGYFFGVTCGGQYNFHARDFENDTDTVLASLTNGTGITPGANQTNRLGVRAEGQKIGLYANGVLLQEFNDAAYSGGSFGPFVAANETPGFTVWMEEISLWELP